MKERLLIFFGGITMSILGLIKPDLYYEFIIKTFRYASKDLSDEDILLLLKSYK